MIKAIIFDLDGTLMDSQAAILGAFEHVLTSHGQIYHEPTVRSHVGRVLTDTYQALAPDHEPEKLIALHRSWQAENKHLLKGFEGLEKFLGSLKQKGLKIGAYTSAYRSRTDMMLQNTNTAQYFDSVLCGDEVVHPKPHQEGVVTLAKRMRVKLSEVVMVGDAKHDIESGKDAGVTTIGITHGFGTRQSLKEAGADYLVHNLTELADLLNTL